MSGGGGEPAEGEEELGAVVENIGKGGGKTKVVGVFFHVSGAGNISFRVGDTGDDPQHGPVPGGVSTQVS